MIPFLFFLVGLFQNGRNLPNRKEAAPTPLFGTSQTVRDSRVRLLPLCGEEAEDVLVMGCVVKCACVCASVIVSLNNEHELILRGNIGICNLL